ncbi:MAG: RNA 3'-terminal phosphate cyclase [Candidatus Scalindua rubra]|uniref:RNA 3'-terminal phosphate cyclase n=1 Tax=Candidatus Scalindua rubra TaxID=1872076 RepID=A0A1E3X3B3_9BACT|nr:MAG: RNA 3'-terminal phosphate cyclase [Candidatus Scalindua rubra]
MIKIDGSYGEGGGQILRTALTLSAIENKPFEMFNIRAGRKKPGLAPQHLQCVEAMAQICNAEVNGAKVGSLSLKFNPGEIKHGNYCFEIGTAGSVSLVLQTTFLPLALAKESSSVTIRGGTHVPFSPCFHYLKEQWLYYLKKIGLDAKIEMARAGFYPKGGGEINISIKHVEKVCPLELMERGRLLKLRGISAVGNLDLSIAERQKKQAFKHLSKRNILPEIDVVTMPAFAKGTMLLLIGEFENSQCCYFSLGAIGKRAEKVADEACEELGHFLETKGVVDEHLADQVILPLSLAKDISKFTTPKITQHFLTNAEVIRLFLNTRIHIEGEFGEEGLVTIEKEKS